MAYWINPGLENLILKVFQDIDFHYSIGILKNSNDNLGIKGKGLACKLKKVNATLK